MTVEHLKKAIPYVINEAKTHGLYYSNVGVTAEQITDAFMFTKELHSTRGKRQGYHYKFSFSKDESISAEDAFEFIKEWAQEYLGDNYDYVLSAHQDREHMHMHLVFNSVNHQGKKFNAPNSEWERVIKPLTNRVADKYHTGHLKEKDPSLDYDRNYDKEIVSVEEKQPIKQTENHKFTWSDKVRKDMDECIVRSKSYADFKRRMQVEFHYKLREGVSREHGLYLALTPPGKANAVRSYRLGFNYQPGQIEYRINQQRGKNYDWRTIRTSAYIPYDQLSEFQKMRVRKMLEARSLYKKTNTPLQIHEQSVRAIRKMMAECKSIETLEPKKTQGKSNPQRIHMVHEQSKSMEKMDKVVSKNRIIDNPEQGKKH